MNNKFVIEKNGEKNLVCSNAGEKIKISLSKNEKCYFYFIENEK